MSKTAYVAFDLGAESGRAMLATLDQAAGQEKLELEEVHRFLNTPRITPSGLHWDLLGLWGNLLDGLKKCVARAAEQGVVIVSVGVDTWGVDFGLVGKSGQLLGLPYCYRDERSGPAMEKAFATVDAKEIYAGTGIQFMSINSMYQLVAQQTAEPGVLDLADRFLNMPDVLHYFFSGEQVNEATIASTTQMVDPRTGDWNRELIAKLGLPTHLLGKIVPAGHVVGKIRPAIAHALGHDALGEVDVISPGGHDTAAAVAAVPVDPNVGDAWAYLSSGTWSLMGAELDQPVLTEASREAGFTNERGVGGKIRYLKNIGGLWLVQELRRDFALHGDEYDYATLTQLASEAEPFKTVIDPDHGPFLLPGDMRAKFEAFAESTDQPKPATVGEFVRTALEGLALTYRRVMLALEKLTGRQIGVLHIVGGGGQNQLLNQMTADAIARNVIVGPFEATAAGNALTQAIGHGEVRDLAHLRAIVRNSYDVTTVQPKDHGAYERQWNRYLSVLGK